MKKFLTILTLFTISTFFSQNKEVKELIRIDKEYDSLLISYQKKAKDSLSHLSKNERIKIMAEYENRKNKERKEKLLIQLQNIKKFESENPNLPHESLKCSGDIEMPNLVQRNSKYKETIDKNAKNNKDSKEEIAKSIVTFVVTSDGFVEKVSASGSNEEFNREVEINLYKIVQLKPYCNKGYTMTQRFKMPITVNFKD
jgi:hypothetical protein